MEHSIPEGLTVFALPSSHRRLLRTTNMLERLNKEIKRRTRVAALFPNEASLLRLVSAVLAEISEEWETGRVYLTLDNTEPRRTAITSREENYRKDVAQPEERCLHEGRWCAGPSPCGSSM